MDEEFDIITKKSPLGALDIKKPTAWMGFGLKEQIQLG
ncbi:hypothetical protein AO378_1003 [Moraxella catarrhalis]|nr:hypothetical protein AO378_1003 [Moraxella catarrhalis]